MERLKSLELFNVTRPDKIGCDGVIHNNEWYKEDTVFTQLDDEVSPHFNMGTKAQLASGILCYSIYHKRG